MNGCPIALKALAAVLAVAVCAGCTSMRPVEASGQVLRDAIRDGALVQPGDQVVAVTRDGGSIRVDVASVDREVIRGHASASQEVSVAIDEIVELRKRRADVGRTVLAAGGGYVGLAVAAAAIVFVSFVDDVDEGTP